MLFRSIQWQNGNIKPQQVDVREAPEPLTNLGAVVVLGAIPVLKKKYAKSNKNKDGDT